MAMTSSSHTHILGIPEAAAGVGLKPEHADDIFMGRRVDFFEIHAENYMGDGGPPITCSSVFDETIRFRSTEWVCP